MNRSPGYMMAVFTLAVLQACTSAGNPVIMEEDRQSIETKIQEGVTTKEQVTSMLGDPAEAALVSDGQEVWTYEATRVTPLKRNYIPYFSIISSGSDVLELTLTIHFDDRDVVEKYNWFESITLRRSSIFTRL